MGRADSAANSDIENGQGKVPTVDGTRIEFDQINVGANDQPAEIAGGSWLQRVRAKLSLFLAGMYTGIGCSGVPHSHHTYGQDRDHGPI
ncbi:MAG: hypothetical protein KJN90_07025 [Gammaproteobacteria bacterium]|nr:hypothetical protein [Gammaproteobacteria bacterium]